jgi:hypothetical protein
MIHNFIWWFDNTADAYTQSVIGNFTADLILFSLPALWVFLRTIRQGRILKNFGREMKVSPDGQAAVNAVDGEILMAGKGGIENLTHTKAVEENPLFASNSKWIAFQRQVEGAWEVWAIDVETRKTVSLGTVAGDKRRMIEWQPNNDLVIQMGGTYLTVYQQEIEKRLKQ